ncbi:hypothetical protein BDV38DRAFT_245806 [Aspergillus pseudotamarii]|uniref:Uncharacterized protein n=1 Tax=Aspergillus pseudotamarii TaxID=132259 RepID=A0A5N6ST81_ASPPS|nr:uncharacterized protein BDV38DRAFT_245806 [Aspergillus pseudotamarii]KAE8137896.1 hypothetical protein BDV38DRAFT_245806 [Aspergillus pseudotamarii]
MSNAKSLVLLPASTLTDLSCTFRSLDRLVTGQIGYIHPISSSSQYTSVLGTRRSWLEIIIYTKMCRPGQPQLPSKIRTFLQTKPYCTFRLSQSLEVDLDPSLMTTTL